MKLVNTFRSSAQLAVVSRRQMADTQAFLRWGSRCIHATRFVLGGLAVLGTLVAGKVSAHGDVATDSPPSSQSTGVIIGQPLGDQTLGDQSPIDQPPIDQIGERASTDPGSARPRDRFWLLDVRNQTSDACRVALPMRPRVTRLDSCGRGWKSNFDEYLGCIAEGRPSVIYVHGNRMPARSVVDRGMYVYRHSVARHCKPIDWVIWSWPSQREGFVTYDIRVKADRTDGQGLLVADLLRHHSNLASPTTLVGFSFGGRVITGALHALAGGSLGGYGIPGETIEGANFSAALLAPAIEQNWMSEGGYHDLATRNLESLSVLYNRRDAILKRYWLIDRVRGQMALGFSGPRNFAPRYDGSKLPVKSRDCAPIVGLQHDERDYYSKPCSAGRELKQLLERSTGGLLNRNVLDTSSESADPIAKAADASKTTRTR